MKKIFLGIFVMIAFVVFATPSHGSEKITLINLNQLVEQTNFIVGRGCSGTLVDIKNRLILTNYHCIDDKVSIVEIDETTLDGSVKRIRRKKYNDVTVEQNGYSGFTKVSTATYISEIVAENKKVDLAVLKIKSDLPHKISSKILPDSMFIVRGEGVYAVGNPSGMDATIVRGIISNLNRTFEFPWTGNEKLPMIQFSGGVYGGNSGGALYNDSGFLIGVPAAGHSQATFIGLAIPASIVKEFMREWCLAEAFDDTFNNKKCIEQKSQREKEKKSESLR